MIQRCFNTNAHAYGSYGGRGIIVCDRWRHSFVAFFHDMGLKPYAGAEIERKNNDGPYSPENCCWSTRKEQNRNKRSNHLLTHNGKTQCVTDWAVEVGLKYNTILARLSYGWTVEQALQRPQQRGRKPGQRKDAHMITYRGKTQSVGDWEREYSLRRDLLVQRLGLGWDIERALTTPKELRKGK